MNKIPYTGDGYLDVGNILPHVPPFVWIWGGRGIGKTYGVLKNVRYDNPRKFLIMRRTQKQIDLLRKPFFNPFKTIDADTGGMTAVVRDGDIGIFYVGTEQDGKVLPCGPVLGYAIALSTVHNVRGIDLSDVDVIVYDEFIPEPHERPIKHEYEAFLNAIETIARNRELKGKPPVQFIGLTNSNSLGNPYFLGMGVIRTVDKMVKTGREVWEDPERGLMLINVTRSPISTLKAKTALYRLAREGEFADMSLGNDYVQDVASRTGRIPLAECKPVVSVGELCIYRHKTRNVYYCCDHFSGNPEHYNADETALRKFKTFNMYLWGEYMETNIVFQDILCEILFKKYFNMA